MKDSYIYINDTFLNQAEAVFYYNNRAFRYGDALFETIRVVDGVPQLLGPHLERLIKGMSLLNYHFNPDLSVEYLNEKINLLLEKNQIRGDARLRLTLFRKDGGFYTPLVDEVSLLMEADPIAENGYTLNIRGLTVDVFSDIKKTRNILSPIKSGNALLYVLAGLHKKKNGWDDCILLNDKGNIAEAISSNLFAVKNGVLYTPPLIEGCVDGIMRQEILRIARENRIAVYEIEVMLSVMLNADEVFLTDAINGIRWVGAYKGKRYFNKIAKLLNEKLNQGVRQMSI